jgi:hypothetical protein
VIIFLIGRFVMRIFGIGLMLDFILFGLLMIQGMITLRKGFGLFFRCFFGLATNFAFMLINLTIFGLTRLFSGLIFI